MSVEIRPVATSADRRRFLRLPWSIYPGRYPAWVPPLLREERQRIDPERSPFFEHGTVELLLAWRAGRPVGRIAAIENRLHNEFHGDRVGFFGLFESVDDPEVAGALLDAAAAWLRGRGLERMRGPVNFSTNDEAGLLVENFDDPPCILMTYNPPYYAGLLEGWGLRKAKDLLAYEGRSSEMDRDRRRRLERLLKRSRHEIRARSIDMKRFEEEVALVRDLYNAAWERNWGFVPMTDAEVEHMAKQLKSVIDPDLTLIGTVDGEPAGFALALPDVNQALRHANGRLFPFGIFKLLWHLRRVDRLRVVTLGLLPRHRRSGLDALFYWEIFGRGTDKGYHRAESSWVLEDNHPMLRALDKMGFRHYKTYRLYERALVPGTGGGPGS
jgi:GNAT superfamily N-acetyltransferase